MGKLHGKPKIVTMSHKLSKLVLVKLQIVAILTIKFYLFPNRLHERIKHVYPSCFHIPNNLWSFNLCNFNKLNEFKMLFGGVKKKPIKCLKEILQFGNHKHYGQALNCKDDYVCHAMDPNELKHLFSSHCNINLIFNPMKC
jgi:hypothetical protein